VNITLEAGETYELRVGRVALHETSSASAGDSPEARYLVAETETKTRTTNDGRIALTVEARDRFNNPVSNSPVTFEQPSATGSFETEGGDSVAFPIQTDENGQATVYYNATGKVGTIPVDARLEGTTADEKDVRFEVFNDVVDSNGGGARGGEQAGRTLVILEDHADTFDNGNKEFDITLKNVGSYPVNITGYRLDYVTAIGSQGRLKDNADYIDEFTLEGTSRTVNAYEGREPVFFGDNPIPIDPGASSLTIMFDDSVTTSSDKGVMLSFSVYIEGGLTTTITIHVIP
jgi:hypothetical protein